MRGILNFRSIRVTAHLSIDKFWARTFSAIYLSMILFAGLRPGSFNHPYYKTFLDIGIFNSSDLLINFVGFIPLGFLLMLSSGERSNFKRGMAVAGFGTLISFFLETSQYYFIPGSVSSMIDLVTNIIGTLVGVALFFLMEKSNEHRAWGREYCTLR